MRLKNFLITVSDVCESAAFYKELFGLQIVQQQDGNIIMTGGLVLQDAAVWEECLGIDIISMNHACELYFEEPELENFVLKLEKSRFKVIFVTPLTSLPWGQQIIRIYDPDGNLIEVRTPGRG